MSEQDHPQHVGGGVFEKVAGRAKAMVGRLIGNDGLAEEGELQQTRADTAKDAARLVAEAEQRDREAELAAEQEANRIEQQRIEADLARIEREEQIVRERHGEAAKIEQAAAHARAVVAEQARRDDEVIRQREQDAAAAHVEGIVEAIAIKQQANEAENVADVLETAQRDLAREAKRESESS